MASGQSSSGALGDRLLDLISALCKPGIELEEALRLSLEGLDGAFEGSLARLHRSGPAADTWLGAKGAGLKGLCDRLEDGLAVPAEPRVTSCEQIQIGDASIAEALSSAGFCDLLNVPAIARGHLVAAVQIFTRESHRNDETLPKLIRVLSAQLGHIAVREQMEAALKAAAEYTKELIAKTDETCSDECWCDPETELPRTIILSDRIQQAIRRRQRSGRCAFAVLLMYLDGLQRVRDTVGKTAASEILLSTARRLRGLLRPADTVSEDDERFVIVLEGIRVPEDAMVVAERVRELILRPFPVASSEVRLDPAVGVVFGGPAYDSPEALLRDAEEAADRARALQPRLQLFDLASAGDEEQSQQLESELAGAIRREDFFLEYQPIISLNEGRISGLEVFIRWRHPEMGMVPPDVFIPVAVGSPQVYQLGYWIIDQTCAQIGRWQEELAPDRPPPVAINLSGRQLFHEEFPERVQEILHRNGVEGRQVRLDISETDLQTDISGAARVLDRFLEMGIRFAVDDFSTESSSLSLLHALPVHELKIDSSLVCRPGPQLRKWGVARTIAELAKALDIDVIADGIETREQVLHLRSAGITQAQGYFFSGPVLALHAEEFIRNGYPLDLEASIPNAL